MQMPCKALFCQPMIRNNGDVTVCNYDITMDLCIGNIREHTLSELWYGEKMQQLRINEILGTNIPEKCAACNPDLTMTRREVIDYLILSENTQHIWQFLRRIGERPKVLLVNPLVSDKAPYKMTVSMGLGYIASVVSKNGYECEIIDMEYSRCSNIELSKFIERNSYNVVGITGMTYQAKSGLRLAEVIREHTPEVKICFGGVLATMLAEETIDHSYVDFVITGEGESSFIELLRSLEKGTDDLSHITGLVWKENEQITYNDPTPVLDFADLPLVDRDKMPTHGFIPDDRAFEDKEKGQISVTVMFSRGCPGDCVFCASPKMWQRRMRYAPVEKMINETHYLIYKYGVRNLVIDDDAFTVNSKKVIEFCKAVVDHDIDIKWRCNTKVNFVSEELFHWMKQAGCIKVTYGVESGNDEILKIIRKNFTVEDVRNALELNKKVGIPAGMLMIVGHPYETAQTVADSVSLVQELDPKEGWDFQVMQPHPGTYLRDELSKETGTIISDDWDVYFSDNITYLPESFSETEFLKICREVTGRKVKLAGKEVKLTYSEFGENGCIIKIPPNKWEDAKWDEYAAFYWTGDETCKTGYTHTLGKSYGYITYLFENIMEEISCITVRSRLCSQEVDQCSDVILLINDVVCKTQTVCEKSLDGQIYSFKIDDPEILKNVNLQKGMNTLTFKIEETAAHAHGISILYRSLDTKNQSQEIPIIVNVFSDAQEKILDKRNEKMLPGIPVPILIADTINRCNMKCVMCPQSFEREERRGVMDFDVWRMITHDICCSDELVTDCIFPFWNGEALLHPQFKEMMGYLYRISQRKKSFNSVILHTNAALLTPELSEFILQTNLFGAITFSIDAMTSETFKKIRVNGDFDEVISNIHSFLILRERGEYKLPTVVFQFIVQKENVHEAEAFYRYWKEFMDAKGMDYQVNWDETPPMVKDTIFIKRLITHDPAHQAEAEALHHETVVKLGLKPEVNENRILKTDEFIVKDDIDTLTQKEKPVRKPCIGLWQNFSIRYDGKVSACCTDINSRMELGNIKDTSIWNIWNGETLKKYRIAHIKGEFDTVPICANCKNQPFHAITDELIENYCNVIGQPELYTIYRERIYGI